MFKNLIKINDEFKDKRILSFNKVLKALQENEKYTLDADIIQQWIMKIARKSPQLAEYISKNIEVIQYLAKLATKKNPSDELIRKQVLFKIQSF